MKSTRKRTRRKPPKPIPTTRCKTLARRSLGKRHPWRWPKPVGSLVVFTIHRDQVQALELLRQNVDAELIDTALSLGHPFVFGVKSACEVNFTSVPDVKSLLSCFLAFCSHYQRVCVPISRFMFISEDLQQTVVAAVRLHYLASTEAGGAA